MKRFSISNSTQTILEEIDTLIYVDYDVLFLSPIEDLWNYFEEMSDHQLAGMAYVDTEKNSFYAKDNKIPFYGSAGMILIYYGVFSNIFAKQNKCVLFSGNILKCTFSKG